MTEFQPPEVEQAYKQATKGLVPEFGAWGRVHDQEELDDLQTRADALSAELKAEGRPQHPWHTMWDGPAELRDRASQYMGVETEIMAGRDDLRNDTGLREVIGFILQGLIKRSDTSELIVSYDPGGGDTIPRTIAIHPATMNRDSSFAALAGWVTARMLTPDIVEIILSDKTRKTPILKEDLTEEIVEPTNKVLPAGEGN